MTEVVKKDTKFQKGVSGNPGGRPKGSKNKITLLKQSLELQLRDQAAPDMQAVMDKAVELALEGDKHMIKLLLDLHVSRAGNNDETKGSDKVAIQINTVETPSINTVEDIKDVEIIETD